MNDLIKREDAIRTVCECECYSGGNPCKEGKGCYAVNELRKLPSADRPQGEWIIHYLDKWMVKAECPKCHRRFEFSPRAIWKCCPMCETRMKGADYETAND